MKKMYLVAGWGIVASSWVEAHQIYMEALQGGNLQ